MPYRPGLAKHWEQGLRGARVPAVASRRFSHEVVDANLVSLACTLRAVRWRAPTLFYVVGVLTLGLSIATIALAVNGSWAAVATGLVAAASWFASARFANRSAKRL